jgi:hypothetical protein
MATRSWTSNLNNTDDATFQAFAQGMSDMFNALLTKTADTGQIALPIVAARPAAAGFAGYEVFRFNDDLQATAPIFLKVEYGQGSTLGWPAVAITVGSGSNGAGTITGIKDARRIIQGASAGTATVLYEHAAAAGVGPGGDGYFWFSLGILATAGFNLVFGLERMRNADGSAKNTGWLQYGAAFVSGNTSNPFFSTCPFAQTSVSAGSFPVLFPETTEFVSVGGDVPLLPLEPFYGRRQPPMLGMAAVRDLDAGNGTVIETTLLGASRLFRKITTSGSNGAASFGRVGGTSPVKALAGRWE